MIFEEERSPILALGIRVSSEPGTIGRYPAEPSA
jgi:hypothetical protein